MFILNDKTINVPLDTINLITLTYYSQKSEIMNIYDTNFAFDENIIPLATSFLETNPNIIHAKRYCNINSESIITISNQNDIPNKSQLSYPCFFSDIHNNNLNIKNIQGYSKKLISTIDTNNTNYGVSEYGDDNNGGDNNGGDNNGDNNGDNKNNDNGDNKNNLLVKMYKLEHKIGEFGHCILNEEELTIIVWNWEYANFQIIINKNNPKICQLQMNIYITEDNKIITTKLANFNSIIQKIDKIKNELVSRVK